jgi:GNAT superfamily N-acetyltransferase
MPAKDALSAAQIAHAIERDPIDYWRAWCAHSPGAAWEETPHYTRFLTGAPYSPCNQVYISELPDGDIDAFIAGTLAPFHARSLPALWSALSSVPPSAELDRALSAAGLVPTEPLTGMAIDLSRVPDAGDSTVVIERVRDEISLETWGWTYHNAFGLPDGFADTFVATFRRAGLGDSSPFQHYLGLLDGEAVACATLFLGRDGIASPWHIATLPGARGRGAGSEMTLAPLRDARALGYTLGTLLASPMGRPVYARLGFDEYFRMTQYEWSPQGP